MEHDEIEMSDVMVVLDCGVGIKTADAVSQLKAAGLSVGQVDEQNDIVEGTLPAAKVKSLRALSFVKYVRNVFTYTSDPTPEDHDNSEDVDDMGR